MRKDRLILSVFTCLVVAFSCGKGEKETADEQTVSVTVAGVEPRDISLEAVYTGTLEGEKQAKITSSISEAVVGLPIKEGSRVKKGRAVIFLDKSGSASQYNQARAVYLEAKDNYNKMRNLYQNGAVSEQTLISAETRFEVAAANFESARQQVELISPINGILTDLSVNIGEYPQPGLPLATVAQTDSMRMVVYVESKNIANIREGQKAIVSVDITPEKSSDFVGVIKSVAKSADPDTRLFRVEIYINNSGEILKPGMFARAGITTANLKSVLTIPREAVFSVDGIDKVYTVEDNKAVVKSIGVTEMTEEYAIIGSGLEENQRVIILGRNLVEDGTAVTITELNNDSTTEQPVDTTAESEG